MVRVAVVGVVFLVSVAALVASSTLALYGPGNELAARDQLRDAAVALADAARGPVGTLPADEPGTVLPEPDHRRLAAVVAQVLADYPGTEGGVYFPRSDQFAGTVGPASDTASVATPDDEKDRSKVEKKADKKKDRKADRKEKGVVESRREPPPRETFTIRQLAADAQALPPGENPPVAVRDIGPSRVGIATVPVGADRPARAVAWVMIRLVGPEQQRTRLARLQLATALALAGIVLALGLAAGLARSLRREEHRRAELREQLRKAEHLAGLGRLLAGVAHEIRNPLTAIRSTVQLWQRLPAEARTPESLAGVVGAIDRLNALVGRLLLFARTGHEDRRRVDLNAVAAEALELVRALADAQGVSLIADAATDLPPVAAAGQGFRQVVLDLVANALQAMPAGGRLTVGTRTLPGGRVELSVADTGPGVPADVRAHLFEPFFTTRPDGTGLGLALCREVARQHGGDVTLDPGSGPGATFRLTLPAAPEDAR